MIMSKRLSKVSGYCSQPGTYMVCTYMENGTMGAQWYNVGALHVWTPAVQKNWGLKPHGLVAIKGYCETNDIIRLYCQVDKG